MTNIFEEGSVQRDRSQNTPEDDRARALANHAQRNRFPMRCGVDRLDRDELGIFTNVGHARADGSDPFHELLRRPDAPWDWLGYDTDDSGYSAATIVRLSPEEPEERALDYIAACIQEADLPGLRFGE